MPFFNEVYLNIQFFKSHRIFEVAVESIRLLHQKDSAGAVSFEPGHHLIELLSTRSLRCFHVLESLEDCHVVAVSMLAECFSLSSE